MKTSFPEMNCNIAGSCFPLLMFCETILTAASMFPHAQEHRYWRSSKSTSRVSVMQYCSRLTLKYSGMGLARQDTIMEGFVIYWFFFSFLRNELSEDDSCEDCLGEIGISMCRSCIHKFKSLFCLTIYVWQ